jgi:hypothetical protein
MRIALLNDRRGTMTDELVFGADDKWEIQDDPASVVADIVADLREPSPLDIPPRYRRMIANYIEKRWSPNAR